MLYILKKIQAWLILPNMFSSIGNLFFNWLPYSLNSIKPDEAQILQQLHLNVYWILHRGDNSIHKWINTKPLQTAASKHQQRVILLSANWKHKFLFEYCDNIKWLIQKIIILCSKTTVQGVSNARTGLEKTTEEIRYYCLGINSTFLYWLVRDTSSETKLSLPTIISYPACKTASPVCSNI